MNYSLLSPSIGMTITLETLLQRNRGTIQGQNFGEVIHLDRWIRICAIAFVCVLVAGCHNHAVNDQDAVRTSIEKHLNGRKDLNLQAMTREVKQISVSGDHATALVEFGVNGSNAKMDVEYTLGRQGKEWAVVSSKAQGMTTVAPSAGQMPPVHPSAADKQDPSGHTQ